MPEFRIGMPGFGVPLREVVVAWATRRRTPPADRDRGAAALEFAILLPVFLALVLGTIDMSVLLYSKTVLGNAARDGARAASLGSTYASAQQIAASGASGLLGAAATPVIQCRESGVNTQACQNWAQTNPPNGTPPAAPAGATVAVTINYRNNWITPFFPNFAGLGTGLDISGNNTMVVE